MVTLLRHAPPLDRRPSTSPAPDPTSDTWPHSDPAHDPLATQSRCIGISHYLSMCFHPSHRPF